MEKLSVLIEKLFNVTTNFCDDVKAETLQHFKVEIRKVIMSEATHKNNWKSFDKDFLIPFSHT